MSTLGAVLNSALRSLAANQYALTISSNNIANANDPNYARQRLVTRPAGPDWGAWGIGRGVDIVGVQSIRDMLVEARWRDALSRQSNADTLWGRLSDIEAIFDDSSGSGVLQTINNFFNSFQTLSQDPTSLPYRSQVQSSANALVQAIRTRDQELKQMKAEAGKNITWIVSEVNRLTSEIAAVTEQIRIEEIGVPSHDLRDRRIALVKELSEYVEVNELDSGDYQLTTADNRLLVLNGASTPLIASQVSYGIGAGSLQAELEIRDTYVPKYAAALDQLAYEISEQVNLVHSAAYDLDGNTGINFFEPLTAIPGAAALFSVSATVAGDPRRIAASNLATGNDNGAAMALANLLYAPVFSGGSVTDQYGALVFAVGSDVSAARQDLNEQELFVTQLENRRQSISGVSVEEETLQISQFQRAYEASAQLINAVDALLEATLGMLRR